MPPRSAPKSTSSAAPGNMPKLLPLAQGQLENARENIRSRASRRRGCAEQSGAGSMATRAATPRPSRCSSDRIAIFEKTAGLDSAEIARVAEQSGGAVPAAGALCRRRAAVQARAFRSAKNRSAPGHPDLGQSLNNLATHLRKARPPQRFRAVVQAGACDLREGGRPGASRGRDAAQQSRPGRQGPGPLCRSRAADQALARDPRKGARAASIPMWRAR